MAHFYFVRHGETEWNKADRICGISESPLTELGRQQAAEAGEYIKAQGFRINEILHSPLGRAKETASIISGITGIPMRSYFTDDLQFRREYDGCVFTAQFDLDDGLIVPEWEKINFKVLVLINQAIPFFVDRAP